MPRRRRRGEPTFEESESAVVDGDVPIEPGTARTALSHPAFRTIWIGAFGSNIGRWMQNVVLGAYAYELTGSSTFVGLTVFAQLGPMLLLSVVGGVLADTIDRRKMLLFAQGEQMLFSAVLAVLVLSDEPSRVALLVVVFLIGIGQALHAPAYTAMLPTLVGRRDLGAAISLNSAQMNASRVIGPAIGGLAFPLLGASGVFSINAASYLFVIYALWRIDPPRPVADNGPATKGLRRLLTGFSEARRNPFYARVLTTIAVFSFASLIFIGQMPTLADDNLGISPRSFAYGALYAAFGLGAVTGAVSIGTFLARVHRPRVVRVGLLSFAGLLAALALLRHPAPAYPVVALVGFAYFASVTGLSTMLQEHLPDRIRGRVMALWIMGFGGVVPIGNLVFGPIIDLTSITAVVLFGALVAAALAWWADLEHSLQRARDAGADMEV